MKKQILNLDQFIPGRVYSSRGNRNCFVDYRSEMVFEKDNVLTNDIAAKDYYKFIFLAVQDEEFDYNESGTFYSILKVFYNGRIGYIFVNYGSEIKNIYEIES